MTKPSEYPPPVDQPFVAHLVELRDRLLRVVIVVILVFLGLFAFANDLYTYLAQPLLKHMPQGTSMIATEVASPFLTPFKLTLVVAVFISIPFILYQAWGFIAPALYKKERRLVFPLLLSSSLLFYLGMAFAYFVVFPLVFGFLTGVVPDGVAVMTDISKYLDFVLKMFFAFGLAFEVPIATILVIWAGLTTAEDLAAKRPYIIVIAFIFGMLLTPPDVISQTLLALPMWVLFELGLILSRWYTPKDQDADEDSVEPENPAAHSQTDPDVSQDQAKESEEEEFKPLTEEEMDAELDRAEAEEDEDYGLGDGPHEEYEPFPEEDESKPAPDEKPEDKLDSDTETNKNNKPDE